MFVLFYHFLTPFQIPLNTKDFNKLISILHKSNLQNITMDISEIHHFKDKIMKRNTILRLNPNRQSTSLPIYRKC